MLNSLYRKISRWQALNNWEKLYVLRTTVSLPLLNIVLNKYGFSAVYERMQNSAEQSCSTLPEGVSPIEFAKTSAVLTRAVARFTLGADTCLPQSLFVYSFLKSKGLSPELKIGCNKRQSKLLAHAWVEINSTPLLKPEGSFTAFPTNEGRGH